MDSEGEILMILLANPGKILTKADLAAACYSHREDGGPITAAELQRKYVFRLRRRLRRHGINIQIDGFAGVGGGFVFRKFSLCKPDGIKSSPRMRGCSASLLIRKPR